MSNFKTERDHQIQELLPDLIKHLTKLPENDPRYRRLLESATTKVRTQSELAINGHDVQRRIAGACEKFAMSNYPEYSDKLCQWKDEIASHPFITSSSSDQVDIHWSVLQLLLDVAHNPIVAMTNRVIRNNGKLIEFPVGLDEAESSTHNALVDSLMDINQEIEDRPPLSDELSDWSDDGCEYDDLSVPSSSLNVTAEEDSPAVHNITLSLPLNIKPPERDLHYTELQSADSRSWFTKTTQNSWWCDKEKSSITPVNSKFASANFAEGWNKYLDTLSMGFIADKDLNTTSEYILMREIIWMFVTPAHDCKFFHVQGTTVQLHTNVSTTSCSLPIIQSFLGAITTSMSNLMELKGFASSLQEAKQTLPVVFEIYAACLMEHVNSLEAFVLDVEMRLMEQNDALTSLTFIEQLRENHLHVLDALHRIHKDVIGPWQEMSNHTSSAYLLSKLWKRLEFPLNPLENNLAISILIPCLQSYLSVFDAWWSLGRLHDYSEEFPITEWGEIREYPTQLKPQLAKCPLIQFMVEHCRESNVVLSHLVSMNRTSILSELNNPGPSYQQFLVDFLRPFKIPPRQTEETQTESPVPTNEYYCELMELLQLEDQVKQSSRRREQSTTLSSKELFELFQGSHTNFNLPFLDLIVKSLRVVLDPRIVETHKKVAKIFLDEFKIVNHFRNVNWVLLLESPAMYDFYTDLFVAIEADYNNLSSYQLTAKLDACLLAVHPKMESLFAVEIDRHYYKTELDTILDCLTKLKIEYNFQAGEGVIDFNTTTVYNRTFSFLLQIKWGLWLLENLKYGDDLVRIKFFKEPNVLDFSIRRMGILRFWLLSSIKTIHAYLMHDVIEWETLQLEKNLKSCTSIAKIQKCHQRFLEVIEEKCFLGDAQKDLHRVFQEFLHFILIFRDFWHQLQDISNQDYRLEKKESKKILLDIKIDQLEQTYSNIHQCVIEKLQLETKGHVTGLKEAFLYKQPIIHSNKIL